MKFDIVVQQYISLEWRLAKDHFGEF